MAILSLHLLYMYIFVRILKSRILEYICLPDRRPISKNRPPHPPRCPPPSISNPHRGTRQLLPRQLLKRQLITEQLTLPAGCLLGAKSPGRASPSCLRLTSRRSGTRSRGSSTSSATTSAPTSRRAPRPTTVSWSRFLIIYQAFLFTFVFFPFGFLDIFS